MSNQKRNAPQVINWFKKLTHKENRWFIKFDITDFYPSISVDLLSRAISSLLFSKEETWVKRGVNHSRSYQCNTSRNRLRKMICFNHPFSHNAQSNIWKTFLKLVNKFFRSTINRVKYLITPSS